MPTGVDFAPLREAAEAEISKGLTACQIAVGQRNQILWTQTFGDANPETRFRVASATKPIVASAIWLLIGDGSLDITRPVVDYIAEFRGGGKEKVSVEQVLLMTCGFPSAPMTLAEGRDPARRITRLAAWYLETEPGTQYAYHAGSAHWVLAELIERISGMDFRDFIEQRITRPLGLPRLLGIPRDQQKNILLASIRGLNFDQQEAIEVGLPGAGGAMTAESLAVFYQALLHNPGQLWDPAVLADGTGNIRCTLLDPLMKLPANRTTGVVIGAGFGTTWGKSSTAFGWPGAGGQTAFAEPQTGISFAFLQAGDPDEASHFTRAIRFSNLALELGR